jgi:hypothetical protein
MDLGSGTTMPLSPGRSSTTEIRMQASILARCLEICSCPGSAVPWAVLFARRSMRSFALPIQGREASTGRSAASRSTATWQKPGSDGME